jgi:hypothetical protein
VTFLLDGKPLGSDTTPPFALDVEPALLPRGEHRIRAEAVDNLGRRAVSSVKSVTVAPSGSEVIQARPGESFERAREELRRGGVTVRLAPGRYEVDQLRVGSGARLVGSGPGTVIAPKPGARSPTSRSTAVARRRAPTVRGSRSPSSTARAT